MIVEILARLPHDRLAERHFIRLVRHVGLIAALDFAVVQVDDRVGVANRGDEQALGVVGVARRDHLEARQLRVERFLPDVGVLAGVAALRPAPSCQSTNGMLACPPVIERILPA